MSGYCSARGIEYDISWSSGVFYNSGGGDYHSTGHTVGGSNAIFNFDSDRQMGSYGPRSQNEIRPKTKFYNLLIYAGYPNKIN